MATTKQNNEWAAPVTEKVTSITAQTVRSIAVTMNMSDMVLLIDSFGVHYEALSEMKRNIQKEFVQAVENLR